MPYRGRSTAKSAPSSDPREQAQQPVDVLRTSVHFALLVMQLFFLPMHPPFHADFVKDCD